MTISSNIPRVSFTCNGVTTDFPFPYPVLHIDDLTVIETVTLTGVETVKTTPTHWSVPETPQADGSYPSGVTVRFITAPPNTVGLMVINDPDVTQPVDLTDNGALPVDSQVERPLDRATLIMQRILDKINRSVRQPDGDVANIGPLPAKAVRALKYFTCDANGDPVFVEGTALSAIIVSPYMQTLLDDANSIAARSTLGFPSISGSTPGHVLVTDPLSSGLIWGHRAQDNPIINGTPGVWQRGTTFVSPATGTFTADRWSITKDGVGDVTVRQSTNVPTVAQADVLFDYSLEVDVTTADASISAADVYALSHRIEGFNWRHYAQRIITLSFWVMSSKTGVHAVSVQNSGTDRTFVQHFTVAVADTWERKTIYIDASPSAGTWNYVNGTGLNIRFILAAGSNFTTASIGAWNSNALYASTSQVNVMDSAANFFRITGVQLELGAVATPLRFRSVQSERALCNRYYQKSFPYGTAPVQNAGIGTGPFHWSSVIAGAVSQNSPTIMLPVELRADPSITLFNPAAANANVRNVTDSTDHASAGTFPLGAKAFYISATGLAGSAVNEDLAFHWATDAELYS